MDDFGETAASAGALVAGGMATGEIEVEGDIDWFAVTLVAGTSYTFDHYGGSAGAGGGTLIDPVIEGLYDSNESAIPGTFNDDFGGTTNSQITYTAPVSGEYYLAVRAFLGVTPDIGTYTISSEVLRPDYTPAAASVSSTTFTIGNSINIGFLAQNLGPGIGPNAVDFGVYLSDDSTVTTADQLLATTTATSIATPETSQVRSATLTLPIDQAPGTYFLGVIGDSPNAVVEGDEANNLSDLIPITIAPAPVMLRDAFGTIVSVHETLADALAAAHDNDLIEVSQSYFESQETVSTGLNNLVLDLTNAAPPVLTMLDTGSTVLTVIGSQSVQVFGNSAANLLTTGDDNDTIMGGDGNDTLVGSSGADVLNGDTGRDAVDYSASSARIEVDLFAGTGTNGDATGDTLINIDDITATAFNDLLLGNANANTLQGGGGVDNVNGRGGDDLLLGEAGDDVISGGNDADTLNGGDGADRLFGNGGADEIIGGQGGDTVFGGAGDDTVAAGSENDSVLGQGGADEIIGGGGADILRGGSGSDYIEGGAENDALFGNGNNDTILGGGGDDSIQGNAGADRLFGDAGNDTLSSGLGGDRLDGGTGNDVMNGGGADGVRDVFVFMQGYDQDRINAFDQAGTDRLELDANLWSATNPGLSAQQAVDMFGTLNGTGTILTLDFGNGEILEIQSASGIDNTTFGSDIFII